MSELRDAQGRTEEEFLASYSPKNYPRPSLTTDMVIINWTGKRTGKILLIQRKGHPYLMCWALPGGFVNPDETADQAAARELFEETSLSDIALRPLGLYSTPGRDPRGWTVSYAYIATIASERMSEVAAADDAAAAEWFNFELGDQKIELSNGTHELTIEIQGVDAFKHLIIKPGSQLAFDHAQIIAEALSL